MDNAEFEAVYTEFLPLLLKISCNITKNMEVAEELCQDAFIKLYERKVPFLSKNDVKYWLIRVVKNLSLNHFNRNKIDRNAMAKIKKISKVDYPSAEKEVFRDINAGIVKQAIDKLPDKYREIIVLKEYGCLSYKDISKTLKISESNVKVRVFRAKEMLLKILEGEFDYVSK